MRQIANIRAHSSWVRCLAFHPQGRLASGGEDGALRVWSLQAQAEPLEFEVGLESFVMAAGYSPDGACLAAATLDGDVRVLDGLTGQPIMSPWRRSGLALSLALDQERVAIGFGDGAIFLWNLAEPAPAALFSLPASVRALAWLSGGELAAGSPMLEEGLLWSRGPAGECVRPLPLQSIRSLAPLGQGGLAAGCQDGAVRFREDDRVLPLGGGPVHSLAVQGDWLAAGCQNCAVRLVRLSNREVFVLEGHQGEVTSVAFAPHRPWLASGSQDGTVRLWEVPAE